jgi:hypothetical protein
MSFVRRLFETTIGDPAAIDVLGIKKPSKKAERKRAEKIAEAKAKLGDKYLNVPFKKGEPVEELPASVPRIGRKAKSA